MDVRQTGTEFAEALAARDAARLTEVLASDLDFRALTPNRAWEVSTAAEFVADVLPAWFEEGDHIDGLQLLERSSVADRERIGYLLQGHNGDGAFIVEQQAYYEAEHGRITWLRVLCSGFRPAPLGWSDRAG
jgi:hypothetical protein